MRQHGDLQKVLVIDDDLAIADIVREALRDSGYSILSMPIMDGCSFVSQYRRYARNGARIVLLTGNSHGPDIAQSLGADGFIAKPFAIDDLVMVLAEQPPVS